MELAALKQAVPGLADKSHSDRIKIFAWWMHVHKSQATFTGADIAKCYDALHFSKPSSFGGYISQLVEKKDLLKAGSAYRLENKIREQLEAAYGTPEITVKVTGLLTDLVASIPDMAERAYYQEALICYKHGSRITARCCRHDMEYRVLASVRARSGKAARRFQRPLASVIPRNA